MDRLAAAGRSLVLVSMLAGCSSVPSALNPAEWYSSMVGTGERPEVASPRSAKNEFPDPNQIPETERKATPKGLSGDRGNAKYADPVKREPTPTKPLARRTPPPSEPATQVAAAPKPKAEPAPAAKSEPLVPPPAAVTTQPLPPPPVQVAQAEPSKPAEGKGSYVPSLDRRMPTARDEGPAAPPAVAPSGPPARPDVPETVPLPGQAKRAGLQDHFNKRLQESRPAAPAAAEAVAMPSRSLDRAAAEAADAAPELVPPRGMRHARSARMAPEPKAPAATFQVAALEFSGASAELTPEDRKAVKEVAALYRKTGGTVRIVGRAPSSLDFVLVDPRSGAGGMEPSMARATAVAKALAKAGVPAAKLFVAADPSPQYAAADSGGAQVFLDY